MDIPKDLLEKLTNGHMGGVLVDERLVRAMQAVMLAMGDAAHGTDEKDKKVLSEMAEKALQIFDNDFSGKRPQFDFCLLIGSLWGILASMLAEPMGECTNPNCSIHGEQNKKQLSSLLDKINANVEKKTDVHSTFQPTVEIGFNHVAEEIQTKSLEEQECIIAFYLSKLIDDIGLVKKLLDRSVLDVRYVNRIEAILGDLLDIREEMGQ